MGQKRTMHHANVLKICQKSTQQTIYLCSSTYVLGNTCVATQRHHKITIKHTNTQNEVRKLNVKYLICMLYRAVLASLHGVIFVCFVNTSYVIFQTLHNLYLEFSQLQLNSDPSHSYKRYVWVTVFHLI